MGASMQSAITSKGQATIPKAVRDHLGVKSGDKVRFFIRQDGSVLLLPVIPVTRLRGIAWREGPPATLEEMEEAIAKGAIERAGRGSE